MLIHSAVIAAASCSALSLKCEPSGSVACAALQAGASQSLNGVKWNHAAGVISQPAKIASTARIISGAVMLRGDSSAWA